MKLIILALAILAIAIQVSVAAPLETSESDRFLDQVSPELWDDESRSLRVDTIAAMAERQFADGVTCFPQRKLIPPAYVRIICVKPKDPICTSQVPTFCTLPTWAAVAQIAGPLVRQSIVRIEFGYCLTHNVLTNFTNLKDRPIKDICVGLGICWTPPAPPTPCQFAVPKGFNWTIPEATIVGPTSNLDDATGCHATIGGEPCDSCGLSPDGQIEVSCGGDVLSFGPIDFPFTLTGAPSHIPVDPHVVFDYAY